MYHSSNIYSEEYVTIKGAVNKECFYKDGVLLYPQSSEGARLLRLSDFLVFENEDTKEVIGTTPPINKKQTQIMTKFPSFREIYNNCLTSGIATSESTSIHIQRAVTTMNPLASQYVCMQIEVVMAKEGYTDNISSILRRWFPHGFFSHTVFIGFSTIEQDDSVPEIVVNINSNKSNDSYTHFVIHYLDTPSVNSFISELKQHEFNPPISVVQIKSISPDRGISKEELEYNPNDSYKAHVDFYPFLRSLYPHVTDKEFSIEYIVQDFMNSKSNLLLLVGPPGTAKSTLIRSFIRKEHEVLIIANAQVLESPILADTFRNLPVDKTKKMLTIYEDADVFVSPREKGNILLSSMLNQLDGVISSKEKFIISTNLESLSKVDKALMRPGRCHKVMQFRELRGEEINKAREAIGKPDISTAVNLTLSEALNYTEDQTCTRKANAFGFSNSTPNKTFTDV